MFRFQLFFHLCRFIHSKNYDNYIWSIFFICISLTWTDKSSTNVKKAFLSVLWIPWFHPFNEENQFLVFHRTHHQTYQLSLMVKNILEKHRRTDRRIDRMLLIYPPHFHLCVHENHEVVLLASFSPNPHFSSALF